MKGRKRVLVLDFDADLLITLEGFLEDSGFSVVTTRDTEEAIELLQTFSFDFFVVGNRPPELDAASLVRRVRECGVACGCFIFPCSAQTLREPLADSRVEQESVGWPW